MSSNRRILELLILSFGPLFGTMAWVSAERSVSAGGDWTESVLWFSSFAIAFLLAGAIFRDRFFPVSFFLLSFFPSLFFTPKPAQAIFLAMAIAVSFLGFRNIRSDMDSRIRISFHRSIALGAFSFSFSIALLLSGMYYFGIRPLPWADLVPKFSLAQGGGDYLLKAAGVAYPDLANLSKEGMTVDMFLADMQEKQSSKHPNGGDPAQSPIIRKMELDAGKKEFERLVGRPVSGDEAMADILSEALRHKTIAFLSGAQAEHGLPNGVLPFFLSSLLFLSVLSVSSLLFLLLVPITAVLIRFLIVSGILSVKKVPAEQEIIA